MDRGTSTQVHQASRNEGASVLEERTLDPVDIQKIHDHLLIFNGRQRVRPPSKCDVTASMCAISLRSLIFLPLLPVNHLARAVMLRLNGGEYMRLLLQRRHDLKGLVVQVDATNTRERVTRARKRRNLL